MRSSLTIAAFSAPTTVQARQKAVRGQAMEAFSSVQTGGGFPPRHRVRGAR